MNATGEGEKREKKTRKIPATTAHRKVLFTIGGRKKLWILRNVV